MSRLRIVFGFVEISRMSVGVGHDSQTATAGAIEPSSSAGTVRLDLWLWAVRLFKTRSQAAEACRLGRVTRGDGEPVKPSRPVGPGDELCIKEEFLLRRVRVDRPLARRVAAKWVATHLTDLTAADDVQRARALRCEQRLATPACMPGAGRPTKAQRRALEAWHRAGQGEEDGEEEDEREGSGMRAG